MKNGKHFILVLGIVLLAAACKKNDPDDTPAGGPVISSITPESGPYGTAVTINGSHFSATAGDNTVQFNGKTATVTEAASNKLEVSVPKGAGTGPVTVTVNGKTATGPIFTYTAGVTVTTLAGGTQGYADGTGAAAKFDSPTDVCTDADGNVYVADRMNERIRKITPAGVVTTLAGSTTGYVDGSGIAAKFTKPRGIGFGNGAIYVADELNHRVRKVTLNGSVTTIAGSGQMGFKDSTVEESRFYAPHDVCVSKLGAIYVADHANHRIRKIYNGKVTTVGGGNIAGSVDGEGSIARFNFPEGINVSENGGALYVADGYENGIRKIVLKNVITGVLVSEDTVTSIPDVKWIVSTLISRQNEGDVDGPVATARIGWVYNLCVDATGNIYLADGSSQKIRLVTTAGQVSTIAGSYPFGYVNGSGAVAKFRLSGGVAVDKQGNIYVADTQNHAIRKITIE